MPRSDRARTARVSKKRAIRLMLLVATVAVCAGSAARKTYGQYYWDPNHTLTTSGGGSGTWDFSTPNWFDPYFNQDIVPPGAGDTYFGGGGGEVTLIPRWIFASQLFLNSGGYVFNGTATSNSFSVLHLEYGLTQSASVTGVNVISVPIDSNSPIYVDGGTLDLTNTNPIQPNFGSEIAVAAGATLECIATPQATAMFQSGLVHLSGTLQLDLKGQASQSAPISSTGGVALYDGSKVILTGSATSVSLSGMSAASDQFGAPVSSVISGPAGAVLNLGRLDYSQLFGTFTLENDIDIHVGLWLGSGGIFNKTGTGRLSAEDLGNVRSGGIIDIQQGVFAVVGSSTLNPVDGTNLVVDSGTLSLEAASGSPAYDNALLVTSRSGLLSVGAPSATLGSIANGVTLQGGLTIDTSPSGIANHLTIAGNISGAGQTITAQGTGALTLAGVSTVSTTTAHASFLEVNGTLNSDTVTIDTGGMLGGHGTINGSVSLLDHAVLAPAGSSTSSAGSMLTLLGPAKFTSPDTAFSVNVAGGNAGQYDQVVFSDSLSIQGNLIVNDINGLLAPGSKLWIMDGLPGSSPVTGQFLYNGTLLQSGSEFTLPDGTTYQIDYNIPGDPAGTGNDVVLTTAPEPACTSLLAGTLLLLVRRRRNCRNQTLQQCV